MESVRPPFETFGQSGIWFPPKQGRLGGCWLLLGDSAVKKGSLTKTQILEVVDDPETEHELEGDYDAVIDWYAVRFTDARKPVEHVVYSYDRFNLAVHLFHSCPADCITMQKMYNVPGRGKGD